MQRFSGTEEFLPGVFEHQVFRRVMVVFFAAVIIAPRIYLAITDHAILYLDEIYQSLEQAHRVLYGIGWLPWEYKYGMRSWFLPGALTVLIKFFDLVTGSHWPATVILTKVSLAIFAVGGIAAAVYYAHRIGGSWAAVICAAWCAVFPMSLFSSHRVLTSGLSGTLLMVVLALHLSPTRRNQFYAGLVSGIAFLVRYQSGLFLVVIGLVLLARRRHHEFVAYFVGATTVVFAGGMIDWISWGVPFHSIFMYLHFNLFLGGAGKLFGNMETTFYAQKLVSMLGWPGVILLGVGLVLGARRALTATAVVGAYLIALTLLSHKEARFLLHCIPAAVAVASIGWAHLPAIGNRAPIRMSIVIMILGTTTYHVSLMKFSNVQGRFYVQRAGWSLWSGGNDVNEALLAAGQQEDLCGIAIRMRSRYNDGGYFYLHRAVPLDRDLTDLTYARSNYFVVSDDTNTVELEQRGYRPVQHFRAVTLWRRPGPCKAWDKPKELLFWMSPRLKKFLLERM